MKKIIVLIFIIILAGAGIWYSNRGNKNSSAIQAMYLCAGGKTINVTFYKGESKPVKPGEMPIPSGSVKIVLSDGRNLDLPRTISASGARYANGDESFVFWNKGDTAFITEGKPGVETYSNCAL